MRNYDQETGSEILNSKEVLLEKKQEVPHFTSLTYRVFELQALPGIYGVWLEIATHLNSSDYTITAEPLGDTEILGQVKYFNTNNAEIVKDFHREISITTGGMGTVSVRFKGFPFGSVVRGTIIP
ncbi:hypothetical protein [Pelosinus baikalensis]|uniref:Uncharacterized protein n=1 Tax=Pelosinus baikalensis TaxID=2892015 RepID=A0ABS8I0P7_9FIRM|nr:hypothetical protein [Pelosinus baikalensis]MCC5468521.1 hypothetical protein [Pelosinus baikalensis]